MMLPRQQASTRMPAIAHVEADQLSPGSLGACFRDGARAVVIRGNGWISSLWETLLANDGEMPWKAPLYDLAANLVAHDDVTDALGDVYYFKPGRHSYIGRKIEIRSDGRELTTTPPSFQSRHGIWRMNEQLREQCWTFSMNLMRALAPAEAEEAQFDNVRAVVQHLRYHDTVGGHQALYLMIHNSLGPWARIGYGLDRRREEFRGLLGRRGIADTLALLSLLRPMRPAINGLNRLAGRFDRQGEVPDGYVLLSRAHVDSRYFSALCGSRCNLRTDIFVDGAWLPLPMNSGDMVVLPGIRAKAAYGIEPTIHRVLQARDDQSIAAAPDRANITILLGAK